MLERIISIPWLLTAALLAPLGCAPVSVQTGVLALCANEGASGFDEPHLVINPTDRTVSAFDVNYHQEDCSNGEFVCLDGPIPFIQPLASTSLGDSNIELANSDVRITALANGGSQIEIMKTEPSLKRKVVYNYGSDTSLLSLEIIDTLDGEAETTRYEPCR